MSLIESVGPLPPCVNSSGQVVKGWAGLSLPVYQEGIAVDNIYPAQGK